MSMIDCIMCITNEGIFLGGRFQDGVTWTIDKITLRMTSGRRLRRYAVRVDGVWDSDDRMSLREARAKVERLRELHRRFRPLQKADLLKYAEAHGNTAARDLLLLGGYASFAGSCREYDELLKELEGGAGNAV